MSVPWTRFVQQVTDIPRVIDFYVNTLGTGPVEDLDVRRPVPWEHAWVFTSDDECIDLPRDGNPHGLITAEELAEAEAGVYAGIGGCLEMEFELTGERKRSVHGYPIAVAVDDVARQSTRRWDLDELFEMHRSRCVKIVTEPQTGP